MAEYSKIARGSYVSTGTAQIIQLPFQPQRVKITNTTVGTTPVSGQIFQAFWNSSYNQGTANTFIYSNTGTSPATPYLTTQNISTNGITTFSSNNNLLLGPPKQIVSAASNASLTTFSVTSHGFQSGDVVVFEGLFQTTTTGMPQICGMLFSAIINDANTISIIWNSAGSNYTALSGSPNGAYVRKVLYPYSYYPRVAYINSFTNLTTQTQVQTTMNGVFVLGQQVVIRVPRIWGVLPIVPEVVGTITSVVNPSNYIVSIDPDLFSSFTNNVPVNALRGLSFPQMIAVGDINYGGGIPSINGNSSINGPAVSGAFVNNTSQGFVVGSNIVSAASQLINWSAWYYDIQINS
jgi:hypothetical protein